MIPEGVVVADGVDPEDVLLRGRGEAVYLKVLQMALILRMSSCETLVRLSTTGVIPEGVGVADGINPEDVLL